jgi:putative DNA primase/helicase
VVRCFLATPRKRRHSRLILISVGVKLAEVISSSERQTLLENDDEWRVGLTSFPNCLRTGFNVCYQADHPSFHPAMIALVTGPDGAPVILHRTYLTVDGRKAPLEAPKRLTPGSIVKGAAVRLAAAGDVLGIAEGIETALSASALFGVPCWAATNAAMLAGWQPPAAVKRIIIFADNDLSYAGQAAAYALARRIGPGPVVEVQIPPRLGLTGMMCTGCSEAEARRRNGRV